MVDQQAAPKSLRHVDRLPALGAIGELRAFAAQPPEVRMVAYLRSIRRMMVFFTVIAVIALIGTVILALIDINTLREIHQGQSPFG